MKSCDLLIQEEARNEILNAYYWYEAKLNGLGNRFMESLDFCFERITLSPLSFPKKYKEMRQAIVVHFPFVVIFEIEENQIIVYAVFNTRRKPKQWKNL
jgi:hypothetical protein